MKVVDGPALKFELIRLCAQSNQIKFAVAFWGAGAIDIFGSRKSLKHVTAICNLQTGGTNPSVIEELINRGADVRHSDSLHAKLYIFEHEAVIGSSNLSTNGLSLQGNEIAGWNEINVLFKKSEVADDLDIRFSHLFDGASPITSSDIMIADENWSLRRRAGLAKVKSRALNLLDALKREPDLLANQRIFLVVDIEERSTDCEKKLKKLQEIEKDLDCWEDWDDMPESATFVCFSKGLRGGITFEGFFISPEQRREETLNNGSKIQIVRKLTQIKGIRKRGPLKDWQALIENILEKEGSREGDCVVEFSRLREIILTSSEMST